ncbi:MAG: hypothetical protein KGH64_00130 [Candidatus Micrarchaeota archaeon]|nr:hypothetical protein [Candidatus Micrarchaeota archaeon]MDE1860004.1 hypothetical protein [Candidatus Micrarchaeota archaeon]
MSKGLMSKGLIFHTQTDAPIELVGGKGLGVLKLKALEREVNDMPMDIVLNVPSFFIVPSDLDVAAHSGPIRASAKALESATFAVRSSHPQEDVGEYTFDGIFATKLNVPLVQIADAITYVRQNTITDRSLSYSSEHGIDLEDRMPVIVQAMVTDPTNTGVFFSRVSQMNGVKIVRTGLNSETRRLEQHADVLVVPSKEGPFPYLLGSESLVFNRYEDARAAERIRWLEKALGHPIIVEFAYKRGEWTGQEGETYPKGQFYLLQARRLNGIDDQVEGIASPPAVEGEFIARSNLVNGEGDVCGLAYVMELKSGVSQVGHNPQLKAETERAAEFDKQHPEGYILIAPFLEPDAWNRPSGSDQYGYAYGSIDRATPNKKAVISYTGLDTHHDLEVARDKGILYLGVTAEEPTLTNVASVVSTGDAIHVVSDGVHGFVYTLTT